MTTETDASPLDATLRRALNRRTFLAGIGASAAAFALAACSGNSNGASSTGSAAPETAAAGTTPAATPAGSMSSSTSPAGSVAALALAFKATLTADQQSTVSQAYSLANAELWSNLPQSLLSGGGGGPGGGGSKGARLGLALNQLSDTQLASFTTLLQAATGSASGLGYAEIQQHLNADDYLGANGGGSGYGRANYYIALLGTPADTGTWEFQFGGHHLAVANTYRDGALVGATPSFRGIEPNGQFTGNGIANEPMAIKEAAFRALLAGLPADQLAAAKLSAVYSDLVLGAGKDWAFPTAKDGVQASALAADAQALVIAAIASYVNDIADADAATILAKYKAELADTYIAYSGTAALTAQNDYIRIDGPSVWIEFSMQHGIVLTGNHPHSIWRDRTTDYGGTKS